MPILYQDMDLGLVRREKTHRKRDRVLGEENKKKKKRKKKMGPSGADIPRFVDGRPTNYRRERLKMKDNLSYLFGETRRHGWG